ncbi:MAG: YncE family protein [Alphaproteobacteria bacterium]|nr:YncE family protein [Alphaproteobacteria bacterium]
MVGPVHPARRGKTSKRLCLAALIGLLAAQPAYVGPAAPPLPMKAITDAPFGAVTRRFDYASLDPKRGLLFVADLAGSRVRVFDVRRGRLVKAIAGVWSVHGVLAVPGLDRVYASATGRDEVQVIDEASLSVVARTPAGHYPDGIAWAPKIRRLYVSDEHGDAVTVIDAATNRRIDTIRLGGEVGNTQYDEGSGLIYSNEQTHNDLVGIDPGSDRIVSRDRLPGCEGAHGLLIDAPRRLALIACEDNARLVAFSLASRREIGISSVGEGPDVLAYDPGLHRLYVASESGVISVFQVEARGASLLGQGFLADNAHVVAVDPASHRIFFPLRKVGDHAALRIMKPD